MESNEETKLCPSNPNSNFGHGYEFWELLPNKDFAVGTCKFCHEKIPHLATDSIKDLIEKQKVATRCVDGFLKMSLEDSNILLYLDIVLNDFINFIDRERKILLDTKMCQLLSSSIIGGKNVELISDIIASMCSDNMDNFMDKLELFEEFNADILTIQKFEEVSYSR